MTDRPTKKVGCVATNTQSGAEKSNTVVANTKNWDNDKLTGEKRANKEFALTKTSTTSKKNK